MSLLEDVFLEDEAGEAQELERVIEGDDLDERPRTPDSNENSEKEDEAEEDKRVVDHTAKAKRAVKNPRFILNPARLTGPRGIQIIPEHFKDFKFKGKGHEREDLDYVLKKLEHWAYRLYPKFKFDDCLKKIETLGKKRPVMVHLHKIRTDQYVSEETVQQQDSSGDEAAPVPQEEDEFDRLLQQQIELARSTPAPSSARKEMHTPMTNPRPIMPPKASSSPSISDEQKERMIRNRKLAEERRLARLNQTNNATFNDSMSADPERKDEVNVERVEVNDAVVTKDDDEEPVIRKHNRTNVIDSDTSDDDNVLAVNESVVVDVHETVQKDDEIEEGNSGKQNTALEAVESDEIISSSVPIDNNRSSGNDNDKKMAIEIDISKSSENENDKEMAVEVGVNKSSDNVNEKEMAIEIAIIKSSDNCNDKDLVIENDPIETDITETNSPDLITNENTSKSNVTDIETSIVQENGNGPSDLADKNKEADDNTMTEELMDVDFSDDF